MCWVDSEAQWAGVGWRNVADVEMQLRWLEWRDRRGTEVPGHANNGTLWGRAWRWPYLARPTSAVRRAGVSTNHGQTSACRWLLGRRRWAVVAAYPWPSSALLHRSRCNSQRVTSRKHAQELLPIHHRAIAGCDEVGEASRSQLQYWLRLSIDIRPVLSASLPLIFTTCHCRSSAAVISWEKNVIKTQHKLNSAEVTWLTQISAITQLCAHGENFLRFIANDRPAIKYDHNIQYSLLICASVNVQYAVKALKMPYCQPLEPLWKNAHFDLFGMQRE